MGRSSDSDSDRGRRHQQRRRRRNRSRSQSRSSSSSRSSSRSRSPFPYRNSRRTKRNPKSSTTYRRYPSQSKHRDERESRDYKQSSDVKLGSKKLDGSSSSSSKVTPSSSHTEEKSPEEMLKLKLQMALKAAADADAQLREQGVLTGQFGRKWDPDDVDREQKPVIRSFKEQMDRAKAIDEINAPGFEAKPFQSGTIATPAAQEEKEKQDHHDAAIFGSNPNIESRVSDKLDLSDVDKDNIAHENFFIDPAIKEERWIKKLMNMRQRKLNGEAMF